MQVRSLVILTILSSIFMLRAEPGPQSRPGDEVLQRYLARAEQQRMALRNVSMEVAFEANLPQLKKKGTLNGLRRISKLGKVSYKVLSFIGDRMVRNDVIARYMSAEVKATGNGNNRSMAINEENYKFKYRGMYGDGDWKLHLFELKPRRKRNGLFSGWLWIEAESGLAVRESGRFVKNPSVFLKRIEFLRDYRMQDGVAIPTKIESTIRTRLVGPAELSIRFGEVFPLDDSPRLSAKDMNRTE